MRTAPDHRLQIQGLIDALSELIVEPWPIRALQSGTKKLEARLAEVEAKAQATEKTLVVLMLGGTGVGKSTLLNALAGQPIAGTSDSLRAYTSKLNLFHHEDTPIGFLTQGIEDRFEHHVHTAEPLRDKVVIDAPDVDSTEVKHLELVEAFLPKVDVLLYLTSWQKYRNTAVGDVIASLRGSHSFVFVMNQVDRVRSEAERRELIEHFSQQLRGYGFERPFVLGISAKRAEAGDKAGAVDFIRLEELLVSNLRSAEIRMIKESGVLGRLRTLIQKMRSLTGAQGRDGLKALAEQLDATEVRLREERIGLQQTLLTEVEGLIARARTRFERRFSRLRDATVAGPYGLFLRAHGYLAGESKRPGPAGISAAEHGRHDLKVQSALIRTLEGARAAVRGYDIDDGVLGQADAEQLAKDLVDLVRKRTDAALLEALPPPRSAIAVNAAPMAALLTGLVLFFYLAFSGKDVGAVALFASLLLAVVICYGQLLWLRAADRRIFKRAADERAGDTDVQELLEAQPFLLGLAGLEAEVSRAQELCLRLRELEVRARDLRKSVLDLPEEISVSG